MRLGVIINPMAGIGGRVALKGSDGAAIVEQALARGCELLAGERALTAISVLCESPGALQESRVITAGKEMGARVLGEAGIKYEIVYETGSGETSASDTRKAVSSLCEQGIDLLMFAGGDGTARDVLDALTENGQAETLPVVGIPAGCKIHSAVYAVSPSQAGKLVAKLMNGQPLSVKAAEVMDLDEEAFRAGQVRASCYGYMLVPVDDSCMQTVKQGGIDHEALALQDIAADVVENMQDDCLYFIGAGSTTAAVMDELGLKNTLLGIDIVLNRELIASDVDEKTLLSFLANKDNQIKGAKIKGAKIKGAKIIVTAIGGQGHVFGRGNQQLSPAVIEKTGVENIIIIATNEKLRSLQERPLLVDTGDDKLDKKLGGVKQIITGFEQRTLYKIQ
jgi:predicted polyphosphate/ATP-dependent NAD kinase